MKRFRILFLLAMAACAAPAPPAAPAGLASRPPLPNPLQVVAAERLSAEPDTRYQPPPDYGKAIALGDRVMAVGAPAGTAGPESTDPGSVYIYRRGLTGWAQEARLKPGDQDEEIHEVRRFGTALALQDPFLYISAPEVSDLNGTNTGAVYIFEHARGSWKQAAVLKSPDPAPQAEFGTKIRIDGEHLGVLEGYYQGNLLRLFQGKGGEWRQTAEIQAKELPGARNGIATFDLSGDTLAVAFQHVQGEEAQAQITGEVLLYQFDGKTWTNTGSLPPEVFGGELALDGNGGIADRLAVGSNSALSGFMSGAVVIFERNGEDWRLAETLGSPDTTSAMFWGYGYGPVALQSDLLLAGGPGYSEDSFWDGVAYLYQRHEGRWIEQLRLVPTEDGGSGDFFGSDVAIYGNTLLISAPDEFGNAVYVYDVGER